jgi:hypothetical protein
MMKQSLVVDVLENGPSSPAAKFFDIDWTPPKEGLANKVVANSQRSVRQGPRKWRDPSALRGRGFRDRLL